MVKAINIAFLVVTWLLFTNALFVLYKLCSTTIPKVSESTHACNCRYYCAEAPRTADDGDAVPDVGVIRNPSLAPVDHFLPPGPSKLGPLTSRDSLTRIGSELSFDYSLCPPDSLAGSNQLLGETTPIHSSCPAVFIVGARKGGSTSLNYYLSSHPQFEGVHLDYGPTSGETFHFSSRYYTEQWSTYTSFFPKQDVLTGDASVGNFVNCKVPKRIFESCGNFSKIVIMLRNPVDRYVSNFLMRVHLGTRNYNNNTSISAAIKMDIQHYIDALLSHGIDITTALGNGGLRKWAKFRCLFDPSRNMVYEGLYYVHVLNWMCNYPSENILILNSEEFYGNPSKILKEVYLFLGLDALTDSQRETISSFVYNKGYGRPNHVIQGIEKRKLRRIYKSFNDGILKQLKWDGVVSWNH